MDETTKTNGVSTKNTNLRVDSGFQPLARTINVEWQALLFDAMRMSD
ncbi:MAG: hypothetical protein ACHQQS_14365 [Thermoanaerobaculales bacterium]